jgi:ubiquinone biosynthesis protein COQ4
MKRNGLDAAAIESVAETAAHHGDSDATYVRNHLRETHDIWHAVLGFDTSIAGELGVQAFYLAQIPTHFSVAILTGGLLNLVASENGLAAVDARMSAVAHGFQMGKRAKPLFGLDWPSLFSRDLTELRTDLHIAEPAFP